MKILILQSTNVHADVPVAIVAAEVLEFDAELDARAVVVQA